jgi:hypothetical protein
MTRAPAAAARLAVSIGCPSLVRTMLECLTDYKPGSRGLGSDLMCRICCQAW